MKCFATPEATHGLSRVIPRPQAEESHRAGSGLRSFAAFRTTRAGAHATTVRTDARLGVTHVIPRLQAEESHPAISGYRSLHFGFVDSINATFFVRLHPLISFSRAIAVNASLVSSK